MRKLQGGNQSVQSLQLLILPIETTYYYDDLLSSKNRMLLNANCTGIFGNIGIFYPVVFRAVINCILYLRFAALKKSN